MSYFKVIWYPLDVSNWSDVAVFNSGHRGITYNWRL